MSKPKPKAKAKRQRKAANPFTQKELVELKLPHALPGVGTPITVTVFPESVLGLTTINLDEMRAMSIVLKGGRSRVETHETLIHEILHCVETEARRQKVLDGPLPEAVIEFFASGLLILLAGSGLYTPVGQEEVMKYVEKLHAGHNKGGWDGKLEPEE